MTHVFISVDMEGIAGVATPAQVHRGTDDYERSRALMAGEVNAAIEGAYAGGATRVTVNDGHGDNANLRPEELDTRATLLMGQPKLAGGMMAGAQDAHIALLIGYHAAAGTTGAVLDHTVSGGAFARIRVDGEVWGEADVNAAIAAQFGTPIGLVTGDDKVCRSFASRYPLGPHAMALTVDVKASLGNGVIHSLHPEVARERIQIAAEAAVTRVAAATADTRPEPPAPRSLRATLRRTAQADHCMLVPGTVRASAYDVEYACTDALELRNMLKLFSITAAAA